MTDAELEERGVLATKEERDYAEKVVTLGVGHGKHNTIYLAKRCISEGVEGDFAEAGVGMGGHPALMAWVDRKYGSGSRKVHLYDSFQGVPKCGPEDVREWRELVGLNPDPMHPEACGRIVNPIENVKANLWRWAGTLDPFVFHVGWIQQVLRSEQNTPAKLALLRVDVDLYDSTVPVFEYLYPRVVKGGYIITDDWGESEAMSPCRLAMYRYFDGRGIPRPTPMRIPDTPGTAWWKV